MEDSEIIIAVLRETFPDECKRVGRTNLADIAECGGEVNLVPLDGASRLDLTATLALIASAAAILSSAIKIVADLAGARKTDKEISVEVKMSLPKSVTEKLDPEALERLIDRFSAKINDR